ncbi:MAG: hypothetical protein KIT72_17970 [Polyangiaceae bacterium]|nr:hypothetical protein [Polyangiaceae bacterium]MCW5792303.1 hypothetical protein [Polyangiaceae bacterium]
MAEREPLRSSAALAAYLESLLEGRRAIVFGDSSSDLGERLLERGARLVHVYDSDVSRVAVAAAQSSSRGISYAPLGEGGAAVRDGAFDVALVEDIGSYADVSALLRRVKRSLGARGVALIAARNPDVKRTLLTHPGEGKLSYYDLYDAVSEVWDEVRMLGQTPFVGYAVVDFAPAGEPQVFFDNGYLSGNAEEPEYFIALAAGQPLMLEEFAVVQLPAHEVLGQRSGGRQLEAARSREQSVRARLAKLEEELERAREHRASDEQLREVARRERDAEAVLEGAKREALEGKRRIAELERELVKRDRWIGELEARAGAADERADAIQAELDRTQRSAPEWRKRVTQAEERAERAERIVKQAERERDEARAQLAKAPRAEAAKVRDPQQGQHAEREVGQLREQIERARGELNTLKTRAERAEQAEQRAQARLGELERTARELEAKLREAERAAKQARAQLAEVERSGASESAAELSRLEALLVERGAKVRELERELSRAERVGKQLLAELMTLRDERTEAGAIEGAVTLADPQLVSLAAGATEAASGTAASEAATSGAPSEAAAPSEAPSADLMRQNARLQADLEAARWSVEELEGRLASLAAGEEAVSLSQQLAAARAEILRKAVLIAELKANLSSPR